MDGYGLELVVQSAHAQRGQLTRDGVTAQLCRGQ
jgi:hypothetical protein